MSGLGTFKNAIATVVSSQAQEYTTVYSTDEGITSYLIQCDVACVGDTGVQASIKLVKENGTSAFLVKNVPIPVGSTLQVIDGQKVVLEPGDSLQAICTTTGETVDVIVSLVEDVNVV